MKKYISLLLLSFALFVSGVLAQDVENQELQYRRSSLYSVLVNHSSREFGKEICDVFLGIPVPEKFDNHDLSVKVISTPDKKENETDIWRFLESNAVARRMVAKWFNRDPETGECNMELIRDRGLYDATYFDVQLSKMSQRGQALLADAGEELLNHTFILVNDIRYRDKQKTAKVFSFVAKGAGFAAALYTGNSDWADLGDMSGDLIAKIKGFGVTITSYLYKLEWNEAVAGKFYTEYYMDEGATDPTRCKMFNNNKDIFKLTYLGNYSSASGKTSIDGINLDTPEQMIRKVCARAIDESIVNLQREYDEFKIKTPIFTLEPAITAKVGLKEGVNEKTVYEVLEPFIDNNGRTGYKQVGTIKAVKGKIWDNRYMAVEEKAYGADYQTTTFRKVSGGKFQRGMLVRELKTK